MPPTESRSAAMVLLESVYIWTRFHGFAYFLPNPRWLRLAVVQWDNARAQQVFAGGVEIGPGTYHDGSLTFPEALQRQPQSSPVNRVPWTRHHDVL